MNEILKVNPSLVITPDAGSNSFKESKILHDRGIKMIALDHHEQEEGKHYGIVINNQICDYPNKNLCGCGITWQFCRYIDSLLGLSYSQKYLDLVALANSADMMSLLSFETRHLVTKGLKTENIHNPYILGMWNKNKFKLGDELTSWGTVFYIVPLLNAINRSGTQEEKDIVFNSMLNFKAFEKIPSTKRGCSGELETIVDQAVRICTNVKNRQTKVVNKMMEQLEQEMEEKDMMAKNKVLLFLKDRSQIDTRVSGLAANKIAAKYQRPCAILTLGDDEESFGGSARGCDLIGIKNFKGMCESTSIAKCIGHPGAFGLNLEAKNISLFLSKTDEILQNMPNEPSYSVDYIYDGENVNGQNIIDIADLDYLWGKDFPESLVAIRGLKVTNNMVTLMSPDKNPTLKITLSNGISIIKFHSSEEEYQQFNNEGYLEIDLVGKCNKNVWNDNITPQIFMECYEITDSCKYYF